MNLPTVTLYRDGQPAVVNADDVPAFLALGWAQEPAKAPEPPSPGPKPTRAQKRKGAA